MSEDFDRVRGEDRSSSRQRKISVENAEGSDDEYSDYHVRANTPTLTYDDVIRRMAGYACDDEPIPPEENEAMEEGIADIRAGRTRLLREVMKDLGDDKVIEARNQ